jgi:hypothetical protein
LERSPIPPLIYKGKDYYTAPEKAAILATQFQSPHIMPAAPPFARHDQRVKNVTQPPAEIVTELRGNRTHHPHGSYQQYSEAKIQHSAGGRWDIQHHDSTLHACNPDSPNISIQLYFTAGALSGEMETSPDSGEPKTKLLEKSVAKRLGHHAENNDIIPNVQFDFRKRNSVAQLARLTDCVTHGFNENKHTGLVLLDMEKAYDSVWVEGLIYKLISFEVPEYLIAVLDSYLTGRSLAVTVDGCLSPTKWTTAGIPQGAVLSPLLYNLFTADMPQMTHIQIALFTDDAALYTQSWRPDTITRRLTVAVNRLQSYFTKWRMILNPTKTEAILLTKRRPREGGEDPPGGCGHPLGAVCEISGT